MNASGRRTRAGPGEQACVLPKKDGESLLLQFQQDCNASASKTVFATGLPHSLLFGIPGRPYDVRLWF